MDHRVHAQVDLSALQHNLQEIRSQTKQQKVLAVLKANAYGLGAVPVARLLAQENISALGVGDSHEALTLRQAGINTPILILGAIIDGEIEAVIKSDIECCVHSSEKVALLDRMTQAIQKELGVHIMVDTGMGRLGTQPDQVLKIAQMISQSPFLKWKGLATHFASSDQADHPFSQQQMDRFDDVIQELQAHHLKLPTLHLANSFACLNLPRALQYPEGMIRTGLALCGLNPAPFQNQGWDIKPVLSVHTQVVFLKDQPAGATIGYNQEHRLEKPTRVAVVPMGYADGFPLGLSHRFHMLIHGKRAPLLGRVTMDYTMLDVGHIDQVHVGTKVTVIGQNGSETITPADMAMACGSSPYAICCGLGERVARIPIHPIPQPNLQETL